MTAVGQKRRGGRPSLAQAELIHGRVLDAASASFLRDGFTNTSMDAIAAAAEVSKATLYARFADKQALFEAVVEQLAAQLMSELSLKNFGQPTLRERLIAIADEYVAIILHPKVLSFFRLIVAEGHRFPDMAYKVGGIRVELLQQLLEREVATGMLALPDPKAAAEQFVHMIIGEPQRRALLLHPQFSPAELSRRISLSVDLFLRGCLILPPR